MPFSDPNRIIPIPTVTTAISADATSGTPIPCIPVTTANDTKYPECSRKTRNNQVKCVNCRDDHPANYRAQTTSAETIFCLEREKKHVTTNSTYSDATNSIRNALYEHYLRIPKYYTTQNIKTTKLPQSYVEASDITKDKYLPRTTRRPPVSLLKKNMRL
ncbi:hypothetical protein JTB14_000692 [Gonioctena quinquepunctata]|nr:hypothetical protein JTB14_000692 [Gonioctena quinquepunctata]